MTENAFSSVVTAMTSVVTAMAIVVTAMASVLTAMVVVVTAMESYVTCINKGARHPPEGREDKKLAVEVSISKKCQY